MTAPEVARRRAPPGALAATVPARDLSLGSLLGSGGEADVYAVAGRRAVAFKRYRDQRGGTTERARKLQAMVAQPPAEASPAAGHIAIAWPSAVVTDDGGAVVGFLMPAVDAARTLPVFQLYNPQSRLAAAPGFNWRYLLRTARNIAAIVDALHRAGYVVGDLNESNLLVNRRALVTLVDCDSMQVVDDSGVTYRCPVGKPEFLAPEFHGHALAATDRTEAGDRFALAVLMHLLLMEGVHPYAGVWRGGGDPPDVASRIRRGLTPHRRGLRRHLGPARHLAPPPMAVPLRALPSPVRRLMRAALTAGRRRPGRRPSAADWVRALDEVEANLRTCPRQPEHVYGHHLRRCPWCDRFDAGLPDPFPGPGSTGPLVRRPPRPRPVRAAMAAIRRRLRPVGARVRRVFSHEWPVGAAGVTALLVPLAATVLVAVLVPVVVAAAMVAAEHPRRWARARSTPRALRTVARQWTRPAVVTLAGCGATAAAAVGLGALTAPLAVRATAAIAVVMLVRVTPTRIRGWRSVRPVAAGWLRRAPTLAGAVVAAAAVAHAHAGPWLPLGP